MSNALASSDMRWDVAWACALLVGASVVFPGDFSVAAEPKPKTPAIVEQLEDDVVC